MPRILDNRNEETSENFASVLYKQAPGDISFQIENDELSTKIR